MSGAITPHYDMKIDIWHKSLSEPLFWRECECDVEVRAAIRAQAATKHPGQGILPLWSWALSSLEGGMHIDLCLGLQGVMIWLLPTFPNFGQPFSSLTLLQSHRSFLWSPIHKAFPTAHGLCTGCSLHLEKLSLQMFIPLAPSLPQVSAQVPPPG